MFRVETTGSTRRAELEWIFRNTTSLEWQNKKPRDYLMSPQFHADGDEEVKWQVWIYPSGYSEEFKGYISALLSLRSSPTNRPTIKAKHTFFLLDEEGKEIVKPQSQNQENTFILASNQGHGLHNLVNVADVLKNNVFTLTCKLEYADPNNASTRSSLLPGPSMSLSKEELTSSLNQNLEQLFTNRSEADVCFVINGKEIKAHKMILSARSPVFAAMLKSGMKESVENRVEINDIAPDIFEALLRFVYTDRVDITQLDAKDLLAAANKYLLPLLKLQSQQFLSQTISAENCVELLALADLHNAVHLKKSALNFIRLNSENIMQSDAWKNLKQSRPDLSFVFDVVEALL